MLDNFEFRLTGTGWAELFLAGDNKTATVTLSYVYDSLPDLLTALKRIEDGESVFEKVFFDGETTVTDMLLTILDGLLRIELIEDAYFDQMESYEENRCPMPIFTTYTHDFIAIELLVDSLRDLLSKMTLEEYREKWVEYPFPLEELNNLRPLDRPYR